MSTCFKGTSLLGMMLKSLKNWPPFHVPLNNFVTRPSFKNLRDFLTKWPRMSIVWLLEAELRFKMANFLGGGVVFLFLLVLFLFFFFFFFDTFIFSSATGGHFSNVNILLTSVGHLAKKLSLRFFIPQPVYLIIEMIENERNIEMAAKNRDGPKIKQVNWQYLRNY